MPLPAKHASNKYCPKLVIGKPGWAKGTTSEQRFYQVNYETFQKIRAVYSAYFELLRHEARFNRFVRKKMRSDYQRYRKVYKRLENGHKVRDGVAPITPVPRPFLWPADIEYIVQLYELARRPAESEKDFVFRITHHDLRRVEAALRALKAMLIQLESVSESSTEALKRILSHSKAVVGGPRKAASKTGDEFVKVFANDKPASAEQTSAE